MLSVMLVCARILAVSTGHNKVFWLIWSGIVALVAFVSPLSGVAMSLGNVLISLDDRSPLGLSVGQIAGGCAAIKMLLQLATHKITLHRMWRPSLNALASIVFVIMLSGVVSPFSALPWAPLRKLFLIVLLYLVAATYVDNAGKVLFLQLTIITCAGLGAAWTIGESLSRPVAPTLTTTAALEAARAKGLVGNSNYQAIYNAVALPLAVSFMLYVGNRRWRGWAMLMGLSIIGGVVVTGSRGGLIVLTIGLLLVLLIWGHHRRRVQWFLALLIMSLVFALARTDYTRLRFDRALDSIGEGTAQLQSRVALAHDSLEVWRHYPLLGVGAGNWFTAVSRLETRLSNAASPHVWPAQILAELGTIGFGFYFLFVLLCMKDYRAVIRYLDGESSPDAHLLRGFYASAIAMSLAWTSGNPYNQLWFALLLVGGVSLRFILPQQAQRGIRIVPMNHLQVGRLADPN